MRKSFVVNAAVPGALFLCGCAADRPASGAACQRQRRYQESMISPIERSSYLLPPALQP